MIATFRFWIYLLALKMAALAGALVRRPRRHYRLAILKLDRLGDAVLSLGAVKHLAAGLPAEEVLLVVSPIAEPLFREEFPNTPLLVLPAFCGHFCPDFLRFLWLHSAQLCALDVDSLVCLRHQPSDYLHAIACLIQPKCSHASTWEKPRSSLCLAFPAATQTPYPKIREEVCLELEAHRRVLGNALGKEVMMKEIMPSISCVTPRMGETLVVCPQAGSDIREYPPALLAEALRLFLKTNSMPVHFCVPPGAHAGIWQRAMDASGVAVAAWLTPATFKELLILLAGARLVMAPESGPAHLATAMNKPGVFILGGGHYGMFAPWQKSRLQIWLNHAMRCDQCNWECIQAAPYCITRIAPADIAAALVEVYTASAI
ncbi:glycosyltransferase family 9 protein [Prosthecobacter fluviatilis]|uniref:Glycosyltransferase family 9 protein n=1 Tax=Prosthecobacter fluviatilis TaxID=445931 RepID=A0ABW0KJH2_9BACT